MRKRRRPSQQREGRSIADVNHEEIASAVASWVAANSAAAGAQLSSQRPVQADRQADSAAARCCRGKSARSLELVSAASRILEEIQPATIRAVCYRLFGERQIQSMSKNETNRVSAQLTWARETGQIPWSWVVDETREPERVSAWENPTEYVDAVRRNYRRDRWTDQPEWIEVWSEKGTIRGTLAPILESYGVTFRVMHGYGSATALYQAARESLTRSKLLTVFYVGDHDPSGLHMSEIDLPRRLEKYGGQVELIRLALDSRDTSLGLPSFEADSKRRDPRHAWYRRLYGATCWELDALSPVLLRQRVEDAIVARIDGDAWTRAEIAERAELESLSTILSAWPGLKSGNSGQAQK